MRRKATPPPALMPEQIKARLFCGIFPAGFSWCDRAIEEHGDYKKLAFLSFDTLELTVYAPNSPLMPVVQRDAADLQARRGQRYTISGSGQWTTLGHKGTTIVRHKESGLLYCVWPIKVLPDGTVYDGFNIVANDGRVPSRAAQQMTTADFWKVMERA